MSVDIQTSRCGDLDVKRNPIGLCRRTWEMRKSREEAAETRKSIVRAAAREFRERGIVATGLADLMKAVGLTHGGFYKHFASKDQLVAEATAAAVDSMLEELAAHSTVNSAMAGYLSNSPPGQPGLGLSARRARGRTCPVRREGARSSNGGLCKARGHPGGEGPYRRCPAASSGRGRDDDRRGDDVARGERPQAVGRDPRRGGEKSNGGRAVTLCQDSIENHNETDAGSPRWVQHLP